MTEIRAGHYYHIYNRGVNRGAIFFGPDNYAFFIRRVREYFLPELARVIAYCLMPTHYHLLVLSLIDDFGAQVMRPFGTSYVKAINSQQNRVGTLFQGKYRARLVADDRYLKHLTRYIHLNPVEAGLAARPEDWPYSSYREYIGLRNGTLPHPEIVLGQFPSPVHYRAFVEMGRGDEEADFRKWLSQ